MRVQPRAHRDEIAGEREGALRVRLAAAPIGDRANDALRRFLASRLSVPLAAVRIASGERSRNKRIEVSGSTAARVKALAAASVPESHKGQNDDAPD